MDLINFIYVIYGTTNYSLITRKYENDKHAISMAYML